MRCRFLLAVLVGPTLAAAQSPPHLTGAFTVGLETGVISARTCLSRLPPMARYRFILHRGMNIKSVRDANGRRLHYLGYESGRFVGEGVEYVLRDTLAAADSLCIDYAGAYPVYDVAAGDFAHTDYKGFIAFNGRTVRAAEQTKWYPIVYDSSLGLHGYEKVTYDVRVRCMDCASIFLNGDRPRRGPEAAFTSEHPVAMLLFAGAFEWRTAGSTTIINAELPAPVEARITATVDSIRSRLAQWLDTPYGAPMVFIQHTIIENNPRRQWGFVTYPTIAFSGAGLSGFVDGATGRVQPFVWGYLSHEMAHYYFGTVLQPHGPYRWFLNESLAEYMALRAVRAFLGDSALAARVRPYARHALADTTSPAFHEITSAEQMHARYRYEYAPLLMLALEEALGWVAVRTLLTAMLRSPDQLWDYAAMSRVLAEGEATGVWRRFERECVRAGWASPCIARYAR